MTRAGLTLLAALVVGGCGAAGAPGPQASATPPPSYRASVLADHPIAYWPMDETAGTVMTDASGNQNNGTYSGNVGLARSGPIRATPNAAIALDGAGTWATVPSATGLKVDAVSIELWIRKRTDVEFGAYVTKNFVPGGGAGSGWFQLLNDHHDGGLQFRVTSDDSTVSSTTILALNTWYYVVATYDGTTARIYVNGRLDSSTAVSATPKQTNDPLYLGRRGDGLLNDAMLSSVAIYGTALSADRIAEHWQAART